MNRWLTFRNCFLTGVAVALATLLALPDARGQQPSEKSKQDRIAEIQKQIQALQKQLQELQGSEEKAEPVAGEEGKLPDNWVKALQWRALGPASMGGRIIAYAVYDKDPNQWWAATASGGLLKTTNNGITFEHQFDKESTVSLGDVAVAQSDPKVVWVGTGEHNPRNSVSYGDGVYKSVDGGKTWMHMGLEESFQIGRIAIHPKNPDIVYVGALGRLYGPNEERGLFKTTDGGKSWEKVWYFDEKTGVIDVQMNPENPEELLIAAWERKRDEYDANPGTVELPDGYDGYDPIVKWGPGAGIYKTSDGGKNWKKLTDGLPSNNYGRVGIDYYRKNPEVIYAIIDCEKIGMGTPPSPTYLGVQGESIKEGAKLTRITEEGPGDKAGLKENDLVTAVEGKAIKTYEELTAAIRERKPDDKMKLTVKRGEETKEITVTLGKRPERGRRGPPTPYLGLMGSDVDEGLRVTRVVPDSPAAKAKIQVGDILITMDKKKVGSVTELFGTLREKKVGDKLAFELKRDNKTLQVTVTLAEREGRGGRASTTRPYGAIYGGQRENVQDQQGPDSHEYGGIYRSDDGGETWKRINSLNPRPMYFSQVRVDPSDDKNVYVLGVSMYRSTDGGKTFKGDGANQVHPDQHALWIDPGDGRHMLCGTDGGMYQTYDRMDHWDHLSHVSIGQYYHVVVDSSYPYRVYGGLQDNGSWGGANRSLSRRGLANHDWEMLGGGDGFVCRVDAENPDIVYFESQNGAMRRKDLKTGRTTSIMPRAPRGSEPYRFNWNTPFILSSQNSSVVYSAGNFVFRSLNRGEDARPISPEITRTPRGSATALAECPRNPQVLYVGTDDGYLWVTKDGGKEWTNITDNVGLPGYRWVSSIEPSRHKDGRVYVVFDGHRSDDDRPYVHVSEDYGQSWQPLHQGLPQRTTRVLREDPQNSNMLYLGTETHIYASLNRGRSWTMINNNLPTVAIHEIAIHDQAEEIVAATHGRSLWALDISALREIKPSTIDEEVTLFEPARAIRWRSETFRGTIYGMGHSHFLGEDPPSGATIYYSLAKKAEKIEMKVLDFEGKALQTLKTANEPGLNKTTWNLTKLSLRQQGTGGGRSRRGGRPFSRPVEPGMYRIVLKVDGEEFTTSVKLENDPTLPAPLLAETEEDSGEEEEGDERIDD